MAVDEFYFHRRRVLRRWERWGHPLDSFFFLICLGFLLLQPPTEGTRITYAILAIVNCLVITKDEWEHRELCSGMENWLHALLFILHPVLLLWAGFLWWKNFSEFFFVVLTTFILASLFFVYQILFWNVWRRD